MKKKYKLIGLSIWGLRKIRASFMEFKEKGVTEIVGKNEQGKTSVIDAIEILLKGFRHTEKDMTTKGMNKTTIVGTVGEWTIKRVITDKTNRLDIVNQEGLSPRKPQDFLDTLVNELTFDPQPFLRKSPGDKLKFIMDLLKIDFTEEIDKIATKEEDRLQVGRDIKAAGDFKEPEKIESVDTAELLKQQKAIATLNQEEQKKQQNIDWFEERFSLFDAGLQVLQGKITDTETGEQVKDVSPALVALSKGMLNVKKTFEKEMGKLPKPDLTSSEDLDLKISNATKTNEKATNYTNYINWKEKKDALEAKKEKLKKEIEELRLKKIIKLEKIKMPLEGLKITEEGLYYNDVYCENWATSLGWKIALSLCEKMQPDLRAIFLDNGEHLDKDTRKELDKWATDHDIQVLLTIVDTVPEELDEGVFYIEEGGVFTTQGECIPESTEDEHEEGPPPPELGPIPDINQDEDYSNYTQPEMFDFEFSNDDPDDNPDT